MAGSRAQGVGNDSHFSWGITKEREINRDDDGRGVYFEVRPLPFPAPSQVAIGFQQTLVDGKSRARALRCRNDGELHISRYVARNEDSPDAGLAALITRDSSALIEAAAQPLEQRRTRMLTGIEEQRPARKLPPTNEVNALETSIPAFQALDRRFLHANPAPGQNLVTILR